MVAEKIPFIDPETEAKMVHMLKLHKPWRDIAEECHCAPNKINKSFVTSMEKQKYIEHMVFRAEERTASAAKADHPQSEGVCATATRGGQAHPPKIVMPKIQPPPEIPKPVKLDQPEQPKLPPAPPKAVAPPPQPKVGLFASPKPTEMANNQVKPDVKAGGFGDPIGAKTNPNSTKSHWWRWDPSTVPPGRLPAPAPRVKVRFPALPSVQVWPTVFPAATTWARWLRPALPTAWSVAPANQAAPVRLRRAGFNTVGPAPTQVAIKTTEPAFVPPVVISEPHPQYTPEAAQLRIQGEVTLQVRFLATGQVEVLRVVNGLGHGLDEQAKRVAEQIRFKPAEKDGHPVDHTTLIHVTFQLA